MIKRLKDITWKDKKTSTIGSRRPGKLDIALNDSIPENAVTSEIHKVFMKNYSEIPIAYTVCEAKENE